MSLTAGTRLGAYEILAPIGAGGMGDVYRARDHRLGRDVAIKTLPDVFAHDPDRLARFEREARTLASLNHPNIAAIYGIEEAPATSSTPAIHAIIMELVPGRTLADIVSDVSQGLGTLDLTETTAIARSIAEALEAAHDLGIVHRDLKPANIKVRDDGALKVLDFGLAKGDGSRLRQQDPSPQMDRLREQDPSPDLANSPTLTSPAMTAMGVILGTAAYMAPEQARGKAIDRRADIWAFGVVLYEMLTRRRLFDGETVSDVLAAVLTRPIDFTALPAGTPARMRELIARCLERDPRKRLRDIGEARIALGDATPPDASASATYAIGAVTQTLAPVTTGRSATLPWAMAGLAVVIAAALGIVQLTSSLPSVPSLPSQRLLLEIAPGADGDFIVGSNAGSIIISPDASTVAFLVQTPSGRKLFVRSLATGDARAVPGVADASYPFWSPDSRKIGYFGLTKLYTINLAGGLPEAIADLQQGRGGAWTDEGVILFTPKGGGTIHRVSERGGDVTEVTKLDDARGENAHYWPVALPGGRKFLFFIRSTQPENNGIYLGAVDGSAKPMRVVTSLSSGLFSPPRGGAPGRLLWVRDRDLLAQTFDPETAALSGDVATIAEDVRVDESQRGTFASVADDGTLVCASAEAADFEMATVDRTGRRLATLPIPAGKIVQPVMSPDDRKLVFTRAMGGTADLWTYDFASKDVKQLTTDPDYDEQPEWSADSSQVVYQGRRNGTPALVIATIGGGKAEQIVLRDANYGVGTFLNDGRSMLIGRFVEQDIALVRLADPKTVVSVTPDPGIEAQPQSSPDGRWLAFTSTRSGRSEVVLAEFRDDGAKVTVGEQRLPVSSGGGGLDPHWRKDGKEILYSAPSGELMAVSVTIAGKNVTLGRPTPLPLHPADVGGSGSNWAVNSTHTLFVILEAPRATRQTFRVITGR